MAGGASDSLLPAPCDSGPCPFRCHPVFPPGLLVLSAPAASNMKTDMEARCVEVGQHPCIPGEEV